MPESADSTVSGDGGAGIGRELSYREAFNEALREAMRNNPRVIVMGEDIAGGAGRKHLGIVDPWGGPFRLTKGLIGEFGEERVRDTPVSEAAFVGVAIGAAMTGYRPVVDLMFMDFLGTCFDQILNNAAKIRYMSGGEASVPVTLFTRYGAVGSAGAQHSQALYSLLVHIPGLKCVVPSDPYTAKGLLLAAVEDDDPVFVCNHAKLANVKGSVPVGYYRIPLGKSRRIASGENVTLVGVGYTSHLCMRAAEQLRTNHIYSDVIDLLSLSPLDLDGVLDSVRRTRHVVIVDEATPRCSVASDLAAQISKAAFSDLAAPPTCLTAPHTPVPYSPELEHVYLVRESDIVGAVSELLNH